MKFALLKADAKNNLVVFLIIMYVMMMYFSIFVLMFDPTDTAAFESMMEMLPEGLLAGFGFDSVNTNLTSFILNYYYGFLVFVFPMIYCIIVANRLVAKMVDNGSFAYLLMSPTSRRTIIFTKGCYLLLSIIALFAVLCFGGIGVCRAMFGNMLNETVFLRVNINACLLTMVVGMICFFYSCYFNESRLALSFSAGVNIGFLLLFMLGGVSEQAEILKKCSIFSMLNTDKILEGGGIAGVSVLLLAVVVILFALSIYVFDHKNLSI